MLSRRRLQSAAPFVVTGAIIKRAFKKQKAFCTFYDRQKRRFGGARRDRTADLYNAIVALSQLSYDPKALAHDKCTL